VSEVGAPSAPERDVRGAAVFVVVMAAVFAAPFPVCPTRLLLRIPCPGCGATRAMLTLFRGDLHGSLHLHPLAIPATVLLVPLLLHTAVAIWQREAGRELPLWLLRSWQVLLLLATALWIARFFGALGGPVPV